MNRLQILVAAFFASASLAGCATDPSGQNDPYEQTNRSIFSFDQKIDHAVARPIGVFYNHAVPEFARDGIHNFLGNLDAPVTLGNDVLQGDPARAGQTLGRIVINSTLGVGGLVDVAAKMGIPRHDEDFGQTLGVWGVGEGPYLVLPLAGPSNPRDATGEVADYFMDPLTYMKWNNSTLYMGIRTGMGFVDLRARNVENLDQIERTSVDLYATTRSLYRQHRNAEIRNGAPDTENLPNL
ncbi:MAG: MlaA family lipoprotein [Rhizomicrobium sp.]|jgi:phospholipid-binding lipoprotein MlaA